MGDAGTLAPPRRPVVALAGLAALCLPCAAHGQTNDELAKTLTNPVASLTSVPFQMNYDCCFGPGDGGRYTLNFQPVVPFSLTEKWNLIVRTIVPVVYAESTAPGVSSAFGLSDTTQSFFFSPKAPVGGFTLAAGPVIYWPTGSSELGSKKWGAGVTGLVLRQRGGLTYGLLANHVWSFADVGGGVHPNISSTFLQPFLAYTTKTATTFTLNTESSYNWVDRQWSIPVNLQVTHLYTFGHQRVSLGGGLRVYAATDAAPNSGPGWGLRLIATFLFPH